jgi:lysozyme
MLVSRAAIDIIKQFEGCRLKAYPDPGTGGAPWTIGYGHTSGVSRGMLITQQQAEDFIHIDILKFEKAVDDLVEVDLEQHQFDALVSFAFNCGIGNLRSSTLLKMVNSGKFDAVPAQFMKWTRAAGKELPGLVRRRRAEAALWRGVDETTQLNHNESSSKPDALPPAKTMADSKQGNAAFVTGGLAVMGAAKEASNQAKDASDTIDVVTSILSGPNFLILLAIGLLAGAIWYWRYRNMKETGL